MSIAAATAVLDLLEDEQLALNAEKVSRELREAIGQLRRQYPCLGDIRGAGIFVGAEIVRPESEAPDAALCTVIVNGLRECGVLNSACGPGANVLKFRPPLTFAPAQVTEFVSALRDTSEAAGNDR